MIQFTKIVNGTITANTLDGGNKITYMEGDYGVEYANGPALPTDAKPGDIIFTKNTKAGEIDVYRKVEYTGAGFVYTKLTAAS
ncbi:hypothetical protein [Anaeroselena agilis]|uniref:Uncharacterized protein n=1 Tax=Anaeroselena agilis TaxID=3063788 RepID=A0ABU3NYK6_9FIRM|nr:hypothetical protein [Selenomonadales bacterium 4137-cl]